MASTIVYSIIPLSTIVKMFYYLANLRPLIMAVSEVAVQERYKKSSKNDLKRTLLKSTQKKKALIMNALRGIL